jgi:hypothetical protein
VPVNLLDFCRGLMVAFSRKIDYYRPYSGRRELVPMLKLLRSVLLCLLLLSIASVASADSYDDCVSACDQQLAPCIEQIKLSAGDIQAEEDGIAACKENLGDCKRGCSTAEVQPEAPPPPPQEPPEETLNGNIKIYQFDE